MRRARTLIVSIAAIAMLVGFAPPCLACSCLVATDQEHFSRADVVFAGRATERHDPNAGDPYQDSAQPIHWTFDVESKQKGNVADPQIVSSAASSASCGFEFVVGKRYQVFATRAEDGSLQTSLCDGTRELGPNMAPYAPPPATPAPVPPTPVATAPPPPSPTITPSPSPTPTASPVALLPSPFVPDVTTVKDTSAVPGVIALFAALAALGTAAFIARARRGRR